ncbi:aquaporin [Saccharata proteae CBS 121410]|uniref:Aquaporin n=1 Tax=Saccharata proteae CBS 121410 TaxID=1314787 RepID=A0A9P4LZ16_9PEZI|nr:aquaporin [Saccharata proteae CBS 121410]
MPHRRSPADSLLPIHLRWSKIRLALREPFLEFWGVFIMVLFGNGSIAQATLSKHESSAPGGDGYGSYFAVTWAWALGVMLGIYVAGDSGAYLNPALTFTNCIFRKVPWRRFPSYFIAQLLGGFVASGVVYANYVSAIDQYEGHGVRTVFGDTATASLFCTYPQSFLPRASQFFSDFIPSSALAFVVYALKDSTNNGASMGGGNFFPLALFFVILGVGISFGWETGYAINPARDFGPRVMSYFLGYGDEVFSAYGYYFWIPMVSPFCGCAFGGALYDIFIYTGESPINTEWMGLKRILCLDVAIRHGHEHEQRQKEEGVV